MNFLISAFLVLLTLTALIYFVSGVQKIQKEESSRIIAHISDVQGLVLVKNEGNSDWHTLFENTNIQNGDLIKTDFNSSLSFSLKDHDHNVTVYENSTIKTIEESGNFFLEYIDGAVSINEASHLNDWYILAGRKKISAGAFSKILISRENDFVSKLVLTVESGNAGIHDSMPDSPYKMPSFLLPPDILKEGNSLILEKSILK